tara:strand:- start:257 stop:721 length:465 start_codon:yes stop_codon:yes gene_type:complete
VLSQNNKVLKAHWLLKQEIKTDSIFKSDSLVLLKCTDCQFDHPLISHNSIVFYGALGRIDIEMNHFKKKKEFVVFCDKMVDKKRKMYSHDYCLVGKWRLKKDGDKKLLVVKYKEKLTYEESGELIEVESFYKSVFYVSVLENDELKLIRKRSFN